MFDRTRRSRICLVLQWSRPTCRYLLLKHGKTRPLIVAVGSFDRTEGDSLEAQLQNIIALHNVRFRQVVLLMSRPELDLTTLRLPPATSEELPGLVANLLEHEDESSDDRAMDFVESHTLDDGSRDVMVFSCPRSTITALERSFKAVGASIAHVTFSGLGAVHLARAFSRQMAPTSIVIARGDAEIDISIESNGRPALFRTLSHSTDDPAELGSRLCEEIHRSLSLVEDAEEERTRIYLMGDVAEQQEVAEYLSDHLASTVSVGNPLDQVADGEGHEIEQPSRYANLIGAGLAWNQDGWDVDLLHPRHLPSRANPWKRVGFWSAVAASVIGLLSYVAWSDRTDQLEALAKQQSAWKGIHRRAVKALELQDMVVSVDKWRRDDIVWLDELRSLSERLPPNEEALIRRIDMSSNNQQQGVLNLSVQVKEPHIVAELQNAVRDERHSVTNKRVAETGDASSLPWHFELTVVFQPDGKPEVGMANESDSVAEDPADTALVPTPATAQADAGEESNR